MFARLLGRLFGGSSAARGSAGPALEKLMEEAGQLMQTGDKHGAVAALRAVLDKDPSCVMALNDLGACLADIGDQEGARASFERAFSLDDTFLPAIVNHAKMLSDQRKSQEALPFLEQAKLSNPEFTHVDAVYAGLCLHLGNLVEARHFQLRAWLANFDSLRVANGQLFFASFVDGEARIAAEHRFWAETLKPSEALLQLADDSTPLSDAAMATGSSIGTMPPGQKIRIGYWSPDFRSHSVRYFFRPLLEAHDTDRFEVHLYHDIPAQDVQTAAIKASGAHFHDVAALSDVDLFTLIRSHRLDIFVELAGHTSNNRILMLCQRFAPVQISALGYPPTTGLNTLDGKLMDRHILTAGADRFYTERPVVLPSSFWCFDPKEEAKLSPEPPVFDRGHITFGCVGNIAKITDGVLRLWQRVLADVPGSRLLLRAINFEDDAAIDAVRSRLVQAGIDVARLDLCRPEGGAAFFESYNDIDIILDTFPYNGGTTTCFATYMGVPVVSMVGESLISRMGLSILSNLSAADLAVHDEEAYVHRAVELGHDRDYLLQFKQTARTRFKESCLGNGEKFTAEFEQACLNLLEMARTGRPAHRHQVAALPAEEIIRRAFFVMRRGQEDAARRILAHCLREYPDNGTAHVLAAQLTASAQRFDDAVAYLNDRLPALKGSDRRAALICLARFHILMDQPERSLDICRQLDEVPIDDPIDRLQVELFKACLAPTAEAAAPAPSGEAAPLRIRMLVPCDNPDHFLALENRIRSTCVLPQGSSLSVVRVDESRRIPAYREALAEPAGADFLVFMQKNIELHRGDLFATLKVALETCDIVGFSGASRWQRLDWRLDGFEVKTAAFCISTSERPGFRELQWLGLDRRALVPDMGILDGSLFAVASRALTNHPGLGALFDEELVGSEVLLEEGWIHSARQAGCRLAVHRNLGVLLRTDIDLDARYRQAARIHQASKLGFKAFDMVKDDRIAVSAPLADPASAVPALARLLRPDA